MEAVGRSVNSTGGIPELDMNTIPEFKPVERIAYVHDVSVGMSKFDSSFVKFFLKDCHGDTVMATLFDVQDVLRGVKVAAFKHKAVKFMCVAQEFHGRLSLTIDGAIGIQVYDGPFDYDKFIGSVNYDFTQLHGAYIHAGMDVSVDGWNRCSIEELGKGRYGAYCRMVQLAFSHIYPYVCTDELNEELLSCFSVTADAYFRYLSKKQNTEVIGSLGIYEQINRVSVQYSESDSKLLYVDCIAAVAGTDKPKHFYAHLIKSAFDSAKTSLAMEIQFNSMPLGTKAYVGGVEISKY